MTLRETVDKYLEIAGDFGRAVPLADFRLSREETERHFSVFDEDYQISRYIHFSRPATSDRKAGTFAPAEAFQINGFSHTHVSIDAEIATIL